MGALTKTYLALGGMPALALAACTANAPVASNGARAAEYPQAVGRTVPWRTAVASMAEDYGRPHPGPVGTGASAWVPPAPPPAYVDTSPPPPPVAEAPPPAAVRNRQPGRPGAAAAGADVPRPEAGGAPELAQAPTPAARPPAARPPAAAASAADIARGRKLFADMGCGGCHTLADAGAGGGIGPGLDNNPRLSRDYVFETVHDGRGGMPSFAGQLSDADIRALAAYIVQVSKK